MKLNYLLLSAFFLFSFCVSKVENRKVENQTKFQIEEEEFTEFYKKFIDNDTFRRNRTIIPFPYISIERDDDSGERISSEKMINTFPIQLDKRKWKEKVIFTLKPINSDSVKTIINIEDTGYHVEVFFVRDAKNKKWYAVKVENSSM